MKFYVIILVTGPVKVSMGDDITRGRSIERAYACTWAHVPSMQAPHQYIDPPISIFTHSKRPVW